MPDLRTPPIIDGEREARCVHLSGVEVRQNADGTRTLVGHAAVFDSPSEDLGGFIEELKRGAFRKVLSTNPDVRLLINHDGVPLARTKSGTLRLSEDTQGLSIEADLPDTQTARDLVTSIERGDIDQMSFMFRVLPEGREWFFPSSTEEEDEGVLAKRTITEIAELFDVSVVTFPAYPATEVGVRGVICGEVIASPDGQLVAERFTDVCERVHSGSLEASLAERRELERAAERLRTLTPWQRERVTVTEEGETGEEQREVEERATPAFGDLPLAPRDRSWDANSAEGRVRSWAGEGAPNTKYARAFFWHADGNDADGDGVPDNFGDYKLLFCDVISGKLTAVPRGIFACAGVCQGARSGVDIPEGDMPAVKAAIERYYTKMEEEFKDDSIEAPWENDEGANSADPDAETRSEEEPESGPSTDLLRRRMRLREHELQAKTA